MNTIQKSETIKNGLRKGFQDGSSKMAKRKCFGYDVGSDGELSINPEEAQVVCWIFEQYLAGNSLGKIVNESRFSNNFIEKRDLLCLESPASQGFPFFHSKVEVSKICEKQN